MPLKMSMVATTQRAERNLAAPAHPKQTWSIAVFLKMGTKKLKWKMPLSRRWLAHSYQDTINSADKLPSQRGSLCGGAAGRPASQVAHHTGQVMHKGDRILLGFADFNSSLRQCDCKRHKNQGMRESRGTRIQADFRFEPTKRVLPV